MQPPPDLAPHLRPERALERTPFGEAWTARTATDAAVTTIVLAPELVALVPDRARLVAALRERARPADATAQAMTQAATHAVLLAPREVLETADGHVVLVLPPELRPAAGARLALGRTFATADVAAAARTIGDALHAAHAAGERHGAIFPGVLHLGADAPPRVLGHGIVEALVAAGAERSAVLATLGARAFAAPEAASGATSADGDTSAFAPHADVYALGATLYACLTGKPPFGGRTTALVMATVLADEGLSGEMPQLPRGDAAAQAAHVAASERLTQALLRAVERAPADRWATAGDFVRALEPRVPTPPDAATPPSAAPLATRGGCLGALVMLVGAGVMMVAL